MEEEAPFDRLWREYAVAFEDFDDSRLARWMAQTLAQLDGQVWRGSHPLVGSYRLASQVGHARQIWLKRLATPPAGFTEAACCRAPLLPVFIRDVHEEGLICHSCGETAVELEDLPPTLQRQMEKWGREYNVIHEVAHWDDRERGRVKDYEVAYDKAAESAAEMWVFAAKNILPSLLDIFPALIWEDQDECLEVRAEDIELNPP